MTTITPPFFLHAEGQRVRRDREALLAENARLRNEVARLRAGEEPAEPHQPVTTGGHLLWMLNHSAAEVRLSLATGLMAGARHSGVCFEGAHESRLRAGEEQQARMAAALRTAIEEARRLSEVSDGCGRGVALTLGFVLAQGAGGLV